MIKVGYNVGASTLDGRKKLTIRKQIFYSAKQYCVVKAAIFAILKNIHWV